MRSFGDLYPRFGGSQAFWFQREEVTKAKAHSHHIMELAGLRIWDNLNKMDIIWSSAKAKDVEAALKSIVKATSWIDWWTFAMKSLLLKSTKDTRLVLSLSITGARCQLLVAKTASTL